MVTAAVGFPALLVADPVAHHEDDDEDQQRGHDDTADDRIMVPPRIWLCTGLALRVVALVKNWGAAHDVGGRERGGRVVPLASTCWVVASPGLGC